MQMKTKEIREMNGSGSESSPSYSEDSEIITKNTSMIEVDVKPNDNKSLFDELRKIRDTDDQIKHKKLA